MDFQLVSNLTLLQIGAGANIQEHKGMDRASLAVTDPSVNS